MKTPLRTLLLATLLCFSTLAVHGQDPEKSPEDKSKAELAKEETAKATQAEGELAEKAQPATSDGEAKAPTAEAGSGKDGEKKEEPAKPAHVATAETDCRNGVVLDDGGLESGIGFVPSAKVGLVVQRYESAQFPSREIEKVCVCWLRSRKEDALDFEVVFFKDEGGRPAAEPYATAKGRAEDLGTKEDPARFYPVEVKDVTIPEGPSYIGVRWNPSEPTYVFVCTDQSKTTEKAPGFQQDDRAKGWDDFFNTRDTLFYNHRSVMLRPKAKGKAQDQAEGAPPATEADANGETKTSAEG